MVVRLTQAVDHRLATGGLAPVPELWERRQLRNPRTEHGFFRFDGFSTEAEWRQGYGTGPIQIAGSAQEWPEFKSAAETLRGDGWTISPTWWLAMRLCVGLVSTPVRPWPGLAEAYDSIAAYCSGAPRLARGRSTLVGVSVEGAPIEFNVEGTDISIRRITAADFEVWRQRSLSGITLSRPFDVYGRTAVAELRMSCEFDRKIQDELYRLLAAIRLTKLCSASSETYEMGITAPLEMEEGSMASIAPIQSLMPTVLTSGDGPLLAALSQTLWKRLPPEGLPALNDPGNPGSAAIAYLRYVDAMTIDAPIIERRITNAVVGLEALFLPERADGELSFRLRMSVARIMSEFGYDGPTVVHRVKDAYAVRSAYVHRGLLTTKSKAKVERTAGPIQKLLPEILEYLRLSILICMLSNLSPPKLQGILSDALSTPVPSTPLAEICRPAQPYARGPAVR
jgi:hypothetical protein